MADGPTYRWGDMWTQWNLPNTTFIITTNSYVARSGDLVMGRGIAEQLKTRDRQYAKFFGKYIQWSKQLPLGDRYGCIVWNTNGMNEAFGSYRAPMCWVGIFQVKHHFRDPAVPELIEHSAGMLRCLAERNPTRIFNLNYPGIGFGRLTEAVVEPLLRPLPSNVHIWRFTGQESPTSDRRCAQRELVREELERQEDEERKKQ